MLNWRPEDPDMYEDVQTRWQYENVATGKSPDKRLKRLWRASRDSARTPVQWDDSENAGFTTGEPWFYVNQNYKDINVAQQEADPDSILHFYRKAIALRKKFSSVREGNYIEYRRGSGKLYMYSRQNARQKILVVCSFSKRKRHFRAPRNFYLDTAELALCNYSDPIPNTLQPYEPRVYIWK